MEYPTSNQSLVACMINRSHVEWKQDTADHEQTNNSTIGIDYLDFCGQETTQLVIVHAMLDCSIVPQNRKNCKETVKKLRRKMDILERHFGKLGCIQLTLNSRFRKKQNKNFVKSYQPQLPPR